jgi:hypothetical protein
MERPRRPAFLGPAALDAFSAGGDPAQREEIAQTTARLLVDGARSAEDEAVVTRLVTLADSHGLEVLAELWADAPPETLAGALWRLYTLRQWVHLDPGAASREFDQGRRSAPVSEVVAGVAEPPGPDEVRELADAVLRGVAQGDVATTFERAAAFARVVAAGRAQATSGGDDEAPRLSAVRLVRTAEQLEAAATAHRWPFGDEQAPSSR